ncbi:uncharacterized protein HGUI_02223 [Hanseniaspora guilliermondii]|uniref:MADS-box domain-containing protein n=1 Tax=Hanseniaspora guilliermondii TaxID=56406 RepID=A0A1L0CYP6_9ASCO|nr:uncharacterized protein HGUI_02223 [Hanseniaspora guilliermondii]
MGRKKIDIEPITNDRNKTVTFLKRKQGLFKKAFELSVLCSVDIQVVILGSNRQFYEYTTVDPEEMNKVYYKDNMIHNIQTPRDYDPKLQMNEIIDLNDTSRFKGPWNPNGKTSHKRTHSGRLVYTDDDTSNTMTHSKKHSRSTMSNDLEDIIEQDQYKSKHGHQHILKNRSLNLNKHGDIMDDEGNYTRNDLDKDLNNGDIGTNRNNSKRNMMIDSGAFEDHKSNHISAKKRRVNNSSLLKQSEQDSEIMGKGSSYVFPNPNNSTNDLDVTNRKLPSLDTHKIMNFDNGNNSFIQQQPHLSNNYQHSGNGKNYNMSDLQIKTKQSYQEGANKSFNTRDNKKKNEFDSDNDNLITPTSATSLTGMTFEPNLFTPNISKLGNESQRYQQSNPLIKNSPQYQQQSFTRRPRLRVEIPKTNKEALQKQHESMQMRQNANNPSSIIPLSARGGFGANNGTPVGPLSANLFSAMQYQASNNQLNTPNLNFFINSNTTANDKSAPTSSYMQFLKNGYFDNYQQGSSQGNPSSATLKNRRQSIDQHGNNNGVSGNPVVKQRQQLQSPIFNTFLESGFMMMSPDGPQSSAPNSRQPMNLSSLNKKNPNTTQDINGLDLDVLQEASSSEITNRSEQLEPSAKGNISFSNMVLKGPANKYQIATHFPQLQKQKRESDVQMHKSSENTDGKMNNEGNVEFEGDDSNIVVPVSSKVGSAATDQNDGELVANSSDKDEDNNESASEFLLGAGNIETNGVDNISNNEFLK